MSHSNLLSPIASSTPEVLDQTDLPEDRRTSERTLFRTVAHAVTATESQRNQPCRLWTKDLCEGGACLIGLEELPDDEIYLQFLVAERHDTYLRCAVVRRTVHHRMSITGRKWHEYSYGVRIIEKIDRSELQKRMRVDDDSEPIAASPLQPERGKDRAAPAAPCPPSASVGDTEFSDEDEQYELLGRTIEVTAEIPAGRTYVPLFSALGLVVVYIFLDVMC